jgi:hypothetical protein
VIRIDLLSESFSIFVELVACGDVVCHPGFKKTHDSVGASTLLR